MVYKRSYGLLMSTRMAKWPTDFQPDAQAKWLSAGIVPVLRHQPQKFLLLRAYRYWDFPKGHVERGEEPLAAAVRELEEETGISEVAFPWGHSFIETAPYRGGKVARYYLGEVFSEGVVFGINPQLGFAEHEEFRWVEAAEGSQLLVPRVRLILDWAMKTLLNPPAR